MLNSADPANVRTGHATIFDVAERAGVSTQYLSEVERGLKDPSSEILSAVAGALDLTVRQLSVRAARTPAPYGALCLAA